MMADMITSPADAQSRVRELTNGRSSDAIRYASSAETSHRINADPTNSKQSEASGPSPLP